MSEQVEYAWDGGAGPRVDPNIIGPELERIRAEAQGRLHAEDVVDAARDPASPLHQLFNWDDTEAAELYRAEQARGVIRRLRVIQHNEPPRTLQIAYISPQPNKSPGYVPTAQAMADPVTRDQVLETALAALKGWQNRYGQLEAIANESSQVAKVIEKMEAKAKKKKVAN